MHIYTFHLHLHCIQCKCTNSRSQRLQISRSLSQHDCSTHSFSLLHKGRFFLTAPHPTGRLRIHWKTHSFSLLHKGRSFLTAPHPIERLRINWKPHSSLLRKGRSFLTAPHPIGMLRIHWKNHTLEHLLQVNASGTMSQSQQILCSKKHSRFVCCQAVRAATVRKPTL